jgi:HPt (histidine-containing phosphotransfer) domain-containing protein
VCGGQTRLLRRLVDAARDEVPRLLAECRQGLARRDGDVLRRAAHTLKSTLGYFGATELERQAEQLEAASWGAGFEQAAVLLEQMAPALEALVRELDASPQDAETEERGEKRAS